MRVDRALAKLHAQLTRRGVTSTAAALSAALATQVGATASTGLAASATSAALVGAVMTSSSGGAIMVVKLFGFMSSTKIMAGVAGIIVVAATTITLRQQQTSRALRAEVGELRKEIKASAALRTENQRLLAEKTGEQDTRAAEHAELMKLRTEKDAFLKAIAARKAASGRPSESTTGRPSSGPASGLAPGMISMDAIANVGRATPRAAGETMAWALQQADFKTAAEGLTFGAPERQKLEAFIATLPEKSRSDYGTPEQLVALVMAGSPKPIAGVQVLSRAQPDPDSEIARVQWQYQTGELHQDEIRFRRDADGWKQVVSPALTDRVIAYLKAKQ